MRKINYALLDIKDYFFDSCFAKKEKFTLDLNKIRRFDTIKEFLASDYFNKQGGELAIFWHVTGTETYESTKENYQKIDRKYGSQVVFKVCKSESGTAIREAKEQAWFDIVGSGNDILKYFTDNEWDIERCIKNIPKINALEKLKLTLMLFLPLNIDVQALTNKKLTNKIEHLKMMFKDSRNGFYTKKIEIVNNLIKQIVDGDSKDKIKTFFTKDNYIHEFLNSIDKKIAKIDLVQKDAEDIISYSSTSFSSFYHWYTTLASCLSN